MLLIFISNFSWFLLSGSNSAATGTAVNVVDNLETTVKSSPKKTDTGSKVTPEKVVENVS